MTLTDFFTDNPKVAIALSGGVDSAYLLYAALQNGADVRAYYIKTPFQPRFEYEDAVRLCRELGVPLTVIEENVLADSSISANPANRCYLCKKRMFTLLSQQAEKDGYPIVADGTNASDSADDRPGMQALRELGIHSPLRQAGLTKGDIRQLSREANLFTYDKPAYACLATRFPTGTPITPEKLDATQRSEALLKKLGFTDFRVRNFGDAARIQLPESQLSMLLVYRKTILAELKKDYEAVLLDLEVRP